MLSGLPVIDLHHHYIPPALLTSLQALANGKARLVNHLVSVTLNPDLADVEAHLEAMARAGIDLAVVAYSALSALGPEVCASLNEAVAELQADHPAAFLGAAHVDLRDPATAVRELVRCESELGLRALALPTSAPALQLDDPSLAPLWDKAEQLGLPIILHPASLPVGASTDHGLERSCARPFDTTTAIVRLMHAVLPLHPTLRFVAPHCGGTAPYLKGRLQMFHTAPGERPRSLPRTQRELHEEGLNDQFERLWRQLYVDTAGNGGWTPVVRAALDIVSADRVCFGSDYPLEAHSPETMTELVDAMASLQLPKADLAAVAFANAASLLGLHDLAGGPTDRTGPASAG